MTFGDLIATFGEKLWHLVPVVEVATWEQGVKTKWGRVTKRLDPGLHFFLPLVEAVYLVETNIEVSETQMKTGTTADGENVCYSLMLRHRVTDAAQMYRTIHEPTTTVLNQIEGSAGELVGTLFARDAVDAENSLIDADLYTLPNAVYSDAVEQLAEWGIELQEVAFGNCVVCRTYRVITDASQTVSLGL